MEPRPLAEIKWEAQGGPITAASHVQVETVAIKNTRDGKPFAELGLLDATDRLTLRIWNDHPDYTALSTLAAGEFFEVAGEFYRNGAFGVDVRRPSFRPLADAEREALLGGPVEVRERQERAMTEVRHLVESLADPRLRRVCELFLAEFGSRFARSAGARFVHHARRGGLLEHTAQMMRTAGAVCTVYPGLNRDLLIAGALLHDIGKLWENHVPENGFAIALDERGELLGHISIVIELVNAVWRKLTPELEQWASLQPPSEQVRLHLLHLVASHHGSHEFGSPVVPKTPEAVALNAIDNLDAKLEIFLQGYAALPEIAPHIRDKVKPLNHHLVEPLPSFVPPPDEPEISGLPVPEAD